VIPTDVVHESMEDLGVPGVAVGIAHGGDEEVAGFGVTSLENPLLVDADTLFQIGSITKTFTAVAAMKLVEAGRISLDAPVREYLGDLRLADEDAARAVTMRHLLSHTGGWVGDYFPATGTGDDALANVVAQLDQVEQLTPFGELWSYNNAGFYIAGRVIEVVTGRPYESALRELVLDPLGLQHSFFFPADVITYRFAVGHGRDKAVSRSWYLGRPSAAVGGLVSSVKELLRYARVQWEPGEFLSAESLAEMRRPHAEIGRSMGDAVGLGWYLVEHAGHAFVSHGGATSGQQARLLVAPEDRFALAVLTNHDDGGALAGRVEREVMRALLGVEPAADTHLEPTAAELASYAGEYDSALWLASLGVSDGALVLGLRPKPGFPSPDSPARPGPPPSRLAFSDRDAVVALDPPLAGSRGDFLRGADGEIAWFRWGGRLHRPVKT
jgi:CubicO group peptidase (beta-lactamase class C family)